MEGEKDFWGRGEREPLMNTDETLIRNSATHDSKQLDAPKLAEATMASARAADRIAIPMSVDPQRPTIL